jgi:hypothetical protein
VAIITIMTVTLSETEKCFNTKTCQKSLRQDNIIHTLKLQWLFDVYREVAAVVAVEVVLTSFFAFAFHLIVFRDNGLTAAHAKTASKKISSLRKRPRDS